MFAHIKQYCPCVRSMDASGGWSFGMIGRHTLYQHFTDMGILASIWLKQAKVLRQKQLTLIDAAINDVI